MSFLGGLRQNTITGNSSLTLQTVALWTVPAMHWPFTSEISVKRKHIISVTVMRYFYFLVSVITYIGPPPAPPLPYPYDGIKTKNFPSVPVETWHKRIFKPSKLESAVVHCAKSSKIISLCMPLSRFLARSFHTNKICGSHAGWDTILNSSRWDITWLNIRYVPWSYRKQKWGKGYFLIRG